jgi:hypothetical protein
MKRTTERLLTLGRGLKILSTALLPTAADIKRANSSAEQEDDAIDADNEMDNEDINNYSEYFYKNKCTRYRY